MPKKLPKSKPVKSLKKKVVKPVKRARKAPFMGPLLAVVAVFLILMGAKASATWEKTKKPVVVTGEASPSAQAGIKPTLPTINYPDTLPTGWEKVDTAINGEKTVTYYVSPEENKSVLYLGSRFSLHETGNICGGEPPCIEYGKFDAKVGGKAYTTPLFLSRNRQTGENKYIFQFRLYGFEGATYVSGKVAQEKYLDDIKAFLSTLPTQ